MAVHKLARHWWVMALRGACALAFGILALVFPFEALNVLVIFFGAYALVDGVFALGAALAGGQTPAQWWGLILDGVLGIGVGTVAFVYPPIVEAALLYLVAFWSIVTGIFEVVAAIRLREHIEGELWLGLSGALSVFFGVLLLATPVVGLAVIATLIGLFAILFGMSLLALAMRLRSWHHNLPA